MKEIKVGERLIGSNHQTYFIADIAANHDGDLSKAKELINLAAEAADNAVKFQHFNAKDTVSDYGFKDLKSYVNNMSAFPNTKLVIKQDKIK